jgi:dipeptidyl aminopeptidase/acylaminoacyl peptidase
MGAGISFLPHYLQKNKGHGYPFLVALYGIEAPFGFEVQPEPAFLAAAVSIVTG